ncbi:MAG TPA: EAL domain-containing protein [Gammaproteobacteria bacterium]|nr:EAL domain-containing protein [Gammaproteobacteria bacterium]
MAQSGVVASAAIVLHGRDAPHELLVLHSRCAGWFSRPPWPSVIAHMASVFGLILEEWDLRHRLEQLARLDPLTELPNRRALEAYLERSLARGRRSGSSFAAGIIDLDDFKPINDRLGHEAGDKLLKCLAQRLRSSLRTDDFVARLGGDEFVVVFDGFANPDHLAPRLAELHQTIVAPVELGDDEAVQVDASLGLALCSPLEEEPDFSSTALLRRADLALYQAKRDKITRTQWWHMHTPGTESLPSMDTAALSIAPYGESAARVLRPIQDLLVPITEHFAKVLCGNDPSRPVVSPPMRAHTRAERERTEARQRGYFTALTEPNLDEATHELNARREGRINACCSLDEAWITASHEVYLETLLSTLPKHAIRLRQALPVLSARLARDRDEQLAGYQEASAARNAVVDALTRHLGHARDCLQLTEVLVEALCGLDEVAAVCATRTTGDGQSRITALETAGEIDAALLKDIVAPDVLDKLAVAALPEIPREKAASYALGHCLNFATAQTLPQFMRDDLYRMGLRSAAVIGWPDGRVQGHLWLFSRWPGGFSSADQQTFLRHIGHLLSVGWGQLPDPGIFTVAERRRRRAALGSGALTMHYQPVVDLATGQLVKAEALARLREGDGLLTPNQFLPLLDNEELLTLFNLGLNQALNDARVWADAGLSPSLGVNLPPQGLLDPRYREATARTLAASPLPRGMHIYLELLETETLDLSDLDSLLNAFEPWLALGVRFSEDDLGTGHSSLLRLHRLPFDVVKIDQGLIRLAERPEPPTIRKILAFVTGITHLAHMLGLKVCVEGLENPALVDAAAILGADWGQGFAIAKPMPAHALIPWAKSQRGQAGRRPEVALNRDFTTTYRAMHDALAHFGINSAQHIEAYADLYAQLAEHIHSRITEGEHTHLSKERPETL